MASLADLESSLELAGGPVLAVSQDGTIQHANARLEALFGYNSGELLGRSVDELVPDEARAIHPELREAFFVVPNERSMGTGRELFAKRKDSALVPVEIALTPFECDDQMVVIAWVQDISERRSQQDKIRLALDAASSAMVMVDDAGLISLANQQACRSFGFDMEELIGRPVDLLVPSEIQRRHQVYVSSFLRNPGRREMGRGRAVTARRKDGSLFPVEITLTPIDSHDGRFVMSTIIDITDRKAAEATSQRINADLKRLNDDLSSFAYSASHDLKAPLSTISGLLAYIITDLANGNLQEVQGNLARCQKLTQQLGQRVEDALAVARSDQSAPMVVPIDLEVLFNDLRESVSEVAKEKGVVIETIVGSPLQEFKTDASRLALVLENLLTNAAKYSDPNRTKRWVRLEARLVGDDLHITCEDNGIGIPETASNDVFKMFKRFHPEAAPGSGLGLALTKKNIDHLQGRISFTSAPTGTRFEIVLPNLEETERA